MTKLTVLVGLPASGKSTYAHKMAKETGAIIVSSDQYRKERFGDEDIQGNPKEVFGAVHKQIHVCLEKGIDVIFDATNLSNKHRVAFMQFSKGLQFTKIAVVFATEFSVCLERNANRSRNVPVNVMHRMRESFTLPQYKEGWDVIDIIFDYNPDNYCYVDLFNKMANFSQDNHHHDMTLGKHIEVVTSEVRKFSNDTNLVLAATLHDIGKLYTKKFRDAKGNSCETAHFYNHENVGAYEAMFFLKTNQKLDVGDIVEVCGLIQNHMRMHQVGDSEKAINKIIHTVGMGMYGKLLILKTADDMKRFSKE